MLELNVKTESDIDRFLSEDKELFFDTIIDSIEYGYYNESSVIRIAEFFILDVKNYVTIDMERDDWLESLYMAITFYEEIERYEKCIKVNELIEKLNNK